ncbi:hypothetical protein AB1Y20_017315 [Prymnesium parvum]|uniref:MgtC/SapB/SrpB/YhiD N-terminal domain-containing protein n=1 Tax=Prymnesium parvum TaxID=97485 RepID=A0AB34JN28_PRYPA
MSHKRSCKISGSRQGSRVETGEGSLFSASSSATSSTRPLRMRADLLWCSFFSAEASVGTRIFYTLLALVSAVYTVVALLAPLITPECTLPLSRRQLGQGNTGGVEEAEPNPSYPKDPCRWIRYAVLLGLNKWEADMCCRVVMSIVMGSIIGFERRRADRPAGIRTMAMVCLGTCVFTIDSMFAFVDSTMGWDSSRVSAAIPSGNSSLSVPYSHNSGLSASPLLGLSVLLWLEPLYIPLLPLAPALISESVHSSACTALAGVGFLGAASIWKGAPTNKDGSPATPEIHGLTTATSVWLSAAVGIMCGGGLYLPSFFATAVGVVYLRFAPRLQVSQMETEPSSPDEMESLREPLNPNGRLKKPELLLPPPPPPNPTPALSRESSNRQSRSSLMSPSAQRKASIYA